MKYKNYEIKREDEHNWKLVRYDEVVANRDITSPATKAVVHPKGSLYTREAFKGFHGSVKRALCAIVRDLLGKDCESIKDLIKQIETLEEDLLK